MKTNGDVAAAAATPHSGLIHPHLNQIYSPSQVEDVELPQPPIAAAPPADRARAAKCV